MRLSELSNIDASKNIPEPADSAPAEAGEGGGEGGLPGMAPDEGWAFDMNKNRYNKIKMLNGISKKCGRLHSII